jgi:hypothetical protein
MLELEEFSALVGDIYDASLDPTLWPGVFSGWAPVVTAGFTDRFKKGVGEILDIIKVRSNPDFAPFLQRARSDR